MHCFSILGYTVDPLHVRQGLIGSGTVPALDTGAVGQEKLRLFLGEHWYLYGVENRHHLS